MIHFIQMYLRTRPISGEKAHRIVSAPGAVTLSNMFTTPSPQSSTFIDEEIKMHQECQCRPVRLAMARVWEVQGQPGSETLFPNQLSPYLESPSKGLEKCLPRMWEALSSVPTPNNH